MLLQHAIKLLLNSFLFFFLLFFYIIFIFIKLIPFIHLFHNPISNIQYHYQLCNTPHHYLFNFTFTLIFYMNFIRSLFSIFHFYKHLINLSQIYHTQSMLSDSSCKDVSNFLINFRLLQIKLFLPKRKDLL